MAYNVLFDPSAERGLGKIDIGWRGKIIEAIDDLAIVPRPVGVKKLTGSEDSYRIRVGAYRVLYRIKDRELIVLVIRIAHRRDAYR